MSVVYRDRERFDDSKTSVSARSGGTKVTRYIVKEDDSRTDYGRASRAEPTRQSRYDDRSSYVASRFDDNRTSYDRDDSRFDETRTIRISRNEEEPRREFREPSKITRETITIRRNEDDQRDEYWRRGPGEDVQDRELVVSRASERDVTRDGRASVALSRVDDREIKVDDRRYSDYEVINPPRPADDREISRYIRTSEHYYPQQNQPQTIIIRQEPIIIRERERDRERSRERPRDREEDFQIVKKSEIDDERSVSRRSDRSERKDRDEEYFYEKRVRERIPEDDRRSRLRREVSPGDSISQVGRGRRRGGSESDDSMVYVRKEKVTDYGSRDSSAHRGRDMAAGALAGVGAAELFRNHHQKEGKETSTGISRVAKDAGAGILGAVAAEGIRRYRSKSRRRSRSSSSGRSRRSVRRRDKSRSRSSSNNRFGNLGGIGGLGLAAAAVGVGALIASRHKKDASPDGGRRSRSRSRRRSSSRGRSVSSVRLQELENDPNADDARNPKHRNSRTAAAGAVGAAAAALLEHHRSKSRGRNDSESPNRLKQAVPIVATGLGTAALAHLYEKNKAKKEAEEIIHDEDRRRSRSRSGRSRSRGREGSSVYQDGPRQVAYSDPNLVQYGNEPLYGNNYGEGYYGNARSAEPDYYNNNNRAMVPAQAPPAGASSFDAASGRPREGGRTRSLSPSRSRSRSRGAAAAGAAAGAGVAASAYEQNRQDKRDRSRRRHSSRGSSRQQTYDSRASIDPYNGRDPYEDANWHATHSASYAQGMNDPYGSQAGFYPPPPGPIPQQGYGPQQSYTPQPAYAPTPPPQGTYHPQDFPPPPPNAPQAQQQQFNPYAPNQNPYAPRPRGTDDNVSAGNPSSAPNDQYRSASDGVSRERIISPPRVGPEVTLQRPSTSTPIQPRNSFPGSADNPFAQQAPQDTERTRGIDSGDASPGYRGTPQPTEGSQPSRTFSRAAQRYTPKSQPTPQPAEISRSNQTTPRPNTNNAPIVTDQPTTLANDLDAAARPNDASTPVNQQNAATAMSQSDAEARSRNMPAPTAIPPHMQRSTPRPVRQPQTSPTIVVDPQADFRTSPEPMQIPQSVPEGNGVAQNRSIRPEMEQRGSSRTFATPRMQSPDLRPPSDDSLPGQPAGQRPAYTVQDDNAPSMPNLTIPSPDDIGLKDKEAEDRPARPRTPSPDENSSPRARAPSPTPMNSRKRSVSFNPRLDFNEAPKVRGHRTSDSDDDSPDTARRRRRERERERDRDHHDRTRDKHRRGYDAGDDFSDDTPFEDHRRRSRDNDRDRKSSRRERTDTQSLDRDQERDHDRHDRPKRSNTMGGSSSSGSHHHRRDRDRSPGSDETVDLPERFDERGRKKTDRTSDQDILAQSLDQILGGLFGGKGKK